MNYWLGVGGVLIVQLLVSFVTIFAGTGNGSFVGLGAMLLALYGIPMTVIANFLIIRNHRKNPKKSNVKTLMVISSILPTLQLSLLFAQIALDL